MPLLLELFYVTKKMTRWYIIPLEDSLKTYLLANTYLTYQVRMN